MKLRIDVEKLIAKYNGVAGLTLHLNENGYAITRQAIHRYKTVGGITMGFWLALCEIEMKRGNKLDLWFYVKEGK